MHIGGRISGNASESYEKLRIVLSPSIGVQLPQNALVEKLLTNMFTEREAFVVAEGMRKAIRPVLVRTIRKRTHLPDEELKKILDNMRYTGKILKIGPFRLVLPYLPGGFEFYFTNNRDDPERIKKAGEAHYELIKSGFHVSHTQKGYRLFRVMPAIGPVVKQILVNQTIDVKHHIMPFEMLEKYLAKKKIFAVQRCSCRTAAELAGDPCKRTHENFCVSAGMLANVVIKSGVGRQVNLTELMGIMRKAEKEGLVHETINIQGSSVFICNCCPCCCGFLKSVKELNNKGAVVVSNFQPMLDVEKCVLCDACLKKCPMGVISYAQDMTKKLTFAQENCLGCGICSSICPQGAISLQKVREVMPVKGHIGLFRKMMKTNKK